MIKLIKTYFKNLLISVSGILLFFTSCVDEVKQNAGPKEEEDKMICIPLALTFDTSTGTTKATGDLVNGEDAENEVDFSEGESFAIFLDSTKKVKYVKPIYYSEQLTNQHNSSEDIGEKTFIAVSYVKASDFNDSSPLSYVMVVLNGGPIYSKFEETENKSFDDIIKLTWDVSQNDNNRIGRNSAGLFTMTNSAYYDENNQLMTAVPLPLPNSYIYYSSIDEYIKNSGTPAVTIYVERMVAKFSEPTLSTEVIGSDRFFRPSVAVKPLVVYHWEDDMLMSEELDWRIHLLGWTINGEETSNYVFKNIPEINTLSNWNNWYSSEDKRSYWSIDPHYNTGFYPWQYRKAADRSDIISYMAAVNNGSEEYKPALNYNTFNDIQWRSSTVAPENTIDPTKNNWALDGRENLLAASHLLLTAELYLEGLPGGNYLEGFGPTTDFYSDRIQRYFTEEKEIFKLFLRDFNYMLSTQEQITFHVHDWDDPDNKENSIYTTKPTGECRLYYEKDGKNQLLTNDLINEIFSNSSLHLYNANVRNGDGRVIPWIPGLNVRKPDGKTELSFELTDGKELSKNGEWNDDMYRSLFYEWFGPIDHYSGGKMYYAGEIKHHNFTNEDELIYYGIVRNHWYKFTINAINGLGTPVDDPTQKIIPEKYQFNDQLSVFVEILDWHLKDTNMNLGN